MTTTTLTDPKVNAAALTSFAFDSSAIRSAIINSEPVFIAKDVCDALGIDQYRHAVQRTPDWGKGCVVRVHTLGGLQDMATLNEAGLYWLVLRSDKPEAEPFHRWVCAEVLPAIRKQGGYVVGGSGEERIERLRGLIRVERSMLILSARKAALLSGEPLPERTKAVHARPTPFGELAGSISVHDWVRETTGIFETRVIAQRLVRRLRVLGRPVGKIRNALNSVVLTARPADLASVISPSDCAA